MYCPRCRAEYRDGFAECSDCHVPLSPGTVPERIDEQERSKSVGDTELNVVTVFETRDGFALKLARAALEDAGIDYLEMTNEHPFQGKNPYRQDSLPNQLCWLQVPSEQEQQARALLEPLEHPDPIEVEPEPEGSSDTEVRISGVWRVQSS